MSKKVLKYLVLIAFVLLIVAISSFWVSGPSFREGDVVLKIEGPTQVSGGQEVIYKLKYENNTRSVLRDLNLVFYYPEGSTSIIDGKVEQDRIEDFDIDELGPGEKGEKEFSLFLIGERGNIKVAKATLSFKAGSLTSSFEKNVSFSTTIVDTPITLTLGSPPSAVSGGTINYILDYRNGSDEDANDLVLEFDYPDGFSPQDFNPAPAGGNNTWQVKSLKKGSGGRISISGKLTGKEGESKVVTVNLKRKINDEYVDYQKVSAATVISNPVLGVSIMVGESSDYSASVGDRLNYTVNYKNNSNITFTGMNLSVKLEGDMYDFSTLDTRGGFFDDSTKTITWNSTSVPEFINFFPSISSQIKFSLALKSSFPSAVPGDSNDRFVKATATLSTPNLPTGYEGNLVSVSASTTTKIGTQPAFNISTYYNDPVYGSTGPWPLRVGEETYFTVHWILTNPGNDVENVKIISKLFPGVDWTGTVTTTGGLQNPIYNSNTGEVIWNIDKLPYGTGVASQKYEASFRIKVRPSSVQRGSVVNFMESAQFTGTDSFTKQPIVVNRNSISSNNLTDKPREGSVQ
jgi:hypothetical protein